MLILPGLSTLLVGLSAVTTLAAPLSPTLARFPYTRTKTLNSDIQDTVEGEKRTSKDGQSPAARFSNLHTGQKRRRWTRFIPRDQKPASESSTVCSPNNGTGSVCSTMSTCCSGADGISTVLETASITVTTTSFKASRTIVAIFTVLETLTFIDPTKQTQTATITVSSTLNDGSRRAHRFGAPATAESRAVPSSEAHASLPGRISTLPHGSVIRRQDAVSTTTITSTLEELTTTTIVASTDITVTITNTVFVTTTVAPNAVTTVFITTTITITAPAGTKATETVTPTAVPTTIPPPPPSPPSSSTLSFSISSDVSSVSPTRSLAQTTSGISATESPASSLTSVTSLISPTTLPVPPTSSSSSAPSTNLIPTPTSESTISTPSTPTSSGLPTTSSSTESSTTSTAATLATMSTSSISLPIPPTTTAPPGPNPTTPPPDPTAPLNPAQVAGVILGIIIFLLSLLGLALLLRLLIRRRRARLAAVRQQLTPSTGPSSAAITGSQAENEVRIIIQPPPQRKSVWPMPPGHRGQTYSYLAEETTTGETTPQQRDLDPGRWSIASERGSPRGGSGSGGSDGVGYGIPVQPPRVAAGSSRGGGDAGRGGYPQGGLGIGKAF